MLGVPGASASAMVQKLPLVGFGPCRRAVPSWVEKVVLVASTSECPGCVGVIVGRHGPLGATNNITYILARDVDRDDSVEQNR